LKNIKNKGRFLGGSLFRRQLKGRKRKEWKRGLIGSRNSPLPPPII
jgi:hypothetical protein